MRHVKGRSMFSGIVETQAQITSFEPVGSNAQIRIQRPQDFNDISVGDSIAVNGLCLTVTAFDEVEMQFDLGPETLKVTGWSKETLLNKKVNLERSLAMGARVHGHFVSGHVDEMGKVKSRNELGEALELWISFSKNFKPYIWKKGSVAINGVSLTINEVDSNSLQVTLIPETLRRTNLSALTEGESVTLESDTMARALVQHLKNIKLSEVGL